MVQAPFNILTFTHSQTHGINYSGFVGGDVLIFGFCLGVHSAIWKRQWCKDSFNPHYVLSYNGVLGSRLISQCIFILVANDCCVVLKQRWSFSDLQQDLQPNPTKTLHGNAEVLACPLLYPIGDFLQLEVFWRLVIFVPQLQWFNSDLCQQCHCSKSTLI